MKVKTTFSLIVTALAFANTGAYADGDDPDGGKTFGDGLPGFLRLCDVNGDGVISPEEGQAMGQVRKQMREDFRSNLDYDLDEDGEISKEEAREAVREQILTCQKEKFAEIAGDDGVIDRTEFGNIPSLEGKPADFVDALYAHLDTDPSEPAGISEDEFLSRLTRYRHVPGLGGNGPKEPKGPKGPKDHGDDDPDDDDPDDDDPDDDDDDGDDTGGDDTGGDDTGGDDTGGGE